METTEQIVSPIVSKTGGLISTYPNNNYSTAFPYTFASKIQFLQKLHLKEKQNQPLVLLQRLEHGLTAPFVRELHTRGSLRIFRSNCKPKPKRKKIDIFYIVAGDKKIKIKSINNHKKINIPFLKNNQKHSNNSSTNNNLSNFNNNNNNIDCYRKNSNISFNLQRTIPDCTRGDFNSALKTMTCSAHTDTYNKISATKNISNNSINDCNKNCKYFFGSKNGRDNISFVRNNSNGSNNNHLPFSAITTTAVTNTANSLTKSFQLCHKNNSAKIMLNDNHTNGGIKNDVSETHNLTKTIPKRHEKLTEKRRKSAERGKPTLSDGWDSSHITDSRSSSKKDSSPGDEFEEKSNFESRSDKSCRKNVCDSEESDTNASPYSSCLLNSPPLCGTPACDASVFESDTCSLMNHDPETKDDVSGITGAITSKRPEALFKKIENGESDLTNAGSIPKIILYVKGKGPDKQYSCARNINTKEKSNSKGLRLMEDAKKLTKSDPVTSLKPDKGNEKGIKRKAFIGDVEETCKRPKHETKQSDLSIVSNTSLQGSKRDEKYKTTSKVVENGENYEELSNDSLQDSLPDLELIGDKHVDDSCPSGMSTSPCLEESQVETTAADECGFFVIPTEEGSRSSLEENGLVNDSTASEECEQKSNSHFTETTTLRTSSRKGKGKGFYDEDIPFPLDHDDIDTFVDAPVDVSDSKRVSSVTTTNNYNVKNVVQKEFQSSSSTKSSLPHRHSKKGDKAGVSNKYNISTKLGCSDPLKDSIQKHRSPRHSRSQSLIDNMGQSLRKFGPSKSKSETKISNDNEVSVNHATTAELKESNNYQQTSKLTTELERKGAYYTPNLFRELSRYEKTAEKKFPSQSLKSMMMRCSPKLPKAQNLQPKQRPRSLSIDSALSLFKVRLEDVFPLKRSSSLIVLKMSNQTIHNDIFEVAKQERISKSLETHARGRIRASIESSQSNASLSNDSSEKSGVDQISDLIENEIEKIHSELHNGQDETDLKTELPQQIIPTSPNCSVTKTMPCLISLFQVKNKIKPSSERHKNNPEKKLKKKNAKKLDPYDSGTPEKTESVVSSSIPNSKTDDKSSSTKKHKRNSTHKRPSTEEVKYLKTVADAHIMKIHEREMGRRLAQEIPGFNWLEEKIRNTSTNPSSSKPQAEPGVKGEAPQHKGSLPSCPWGVDTPQVAEDDAPKVNIMPELIPANGGDGGKVRTLFSFPLRSPPDSGGSGDPSSPSVSSPEAIVSVNIGTPSKFASPTPNPPQVKAPVTTEPPWLTVIHRNIQAISEQRSLNRLSEDRKNSWLNKGFSHLQTAVTAMLPTSKAIPKRRPSQPQDLSVTIPPIPISPSHLSTNTSVTQSNTIVESSQPSSPSISSISSAQTSPEHLTSPSSSSHCVVSTPQISVHLLSHLSSEKIQSPTDHSPPCPPPTLPPASTHTSVTSYSSPQYLGMYSTSKPPPFIPQTISSTTTTTATSFINNSTQPTNSTPIIQTPIMCLNSSKSETFTSTPLVEVTPQFVNETVKEIRTSVMESLLRKGNTSLALCDTLPATTTKADTPPTSPLSSTSTCPSIRILTPPTPDKDNDLQIIETVDTEENRSTGTCPFGENSLESPTSSVSPKLSILKKAFKKKLSVVQEDQPQTSTSPPYPSSSSSVTQTDPKPGETSTTKSESSGNLESCRPIEENFRPTEQELKSELEKGYKQKSGAVSADSGGEKPVLISIPEKIPSLESVLRSIKVNDLSDNKSFVREINKDFETSSLIAALYEELLRTKQEVEKLRKVQEKMLKTDSVKNSDAKSSEQSSPSPPTTGTSPLAQPPVISPSLQHPQLPSTSSLPQQSQLPATLPVPQQPQLPATLPIPQQPQLPATLPIPQQPQLPATLPLPQQPQLATTSPVPQQIQLPTTSSLPQQPQLPTTLSSPQQLRLSTTKSLLQQLPITLSISKQQLPEAPSILQQPPITSPLPQPKLPTNSLPQQPQLSTTSSQPHHPQPPDNSPLYQQPSPITSPLSQQPSPNISPPSQYPPSVISPLSQHPQKLAITHLSQLQQQSPHQLLKHSTPPPQNLQPMKVEGNSPGQNTPQIIDITKEDETPKKGATRKDEGTLPANSSLESQGSSCKQKKDSAMNITTASPDNDGNTKRPRSNEATLGADFIVHPVKRFKHNYTESLKSAEDMKTNKTASTNDQQHQNESEKCSPVSHNSRLRDLLGISSTELDVVPLDDKTGLQSPNMNKEFHEFGARKSGRSSLDISVAAPPSKECTSNEQYNSAKYQDMNPHFTHSQTNRPRVIETTSPQDVKKLSESNWLYIRESEKFITPTSDVPQMASNPALSLSNQNKMYENQAIKSSPTSGVFEPQQQYHKPTIPSPQMHYQQPKPYFAMPPHHAMPPQNQSNSGSEKIMGLKLIKPKKLSDEEQRKIIMSQYINAQREVDSGKCNVSPKIVSSKSIQTSPQTFQPKIIIPPPDKDITSSVPSTSAAPVVWVSSSLPSTSHSSASHGSHPSLTSSEHFTNLMKRPSAFAPSKNLSLRPNNSMPRMTDLFPLGHPMTNPNPPPPSLTQTHPSSIPHIQMKQPPLNFQMIHPSQQEHYTAQHMKQQMEKAGSSLGNTNTHLPNPTSLASRINQNPHEQYYPTPQAYKKMIPLGHASQMGPANTPPSQLRHLQYHHIPPQHRGSLQMNETLQQQGAPMYPDRQPLPKSSPTGPHLVNAVPKYQPHSHASPSYQTVHSSYQVNPKTGISPTLSNSPQNSGGPSCSPMSTYQRPIHQVSHSQSRMNQQPQQYPLPPSPSKQNMMNQYKLTQPQEFPPSQYAIHDPNYFSAKPMHQLSADEKSHQRQVQLQQQQQRQMAYHPHNPQEAKLVGENSDYASYRHVDGGNASSSQSSSNKKRCLMCPKSAQFLCSGCKTAWYCSKECQKQHWTDHSPNCGARRQK